MRPVSASHTDPPDRCREREKGLTRILAEELDGGVPCDPRPRLLVVEEADEHLVLALVFGFEHLCARLNLAIVWIDLLGNHDLGREVRVSSG